MQYLKSEKFLGEFSEYMAIHDIETIRATMRISDRGVAVSTGYVRKGTVIICSYNGRFGRGFTVRRHAPGEVRRCKKHTFILAGYEKIPTTTWDCLKIPEVKQCLKSFLQ